jgi:hypothetical protein
MITHAQCHYFFYVISVVTFFSRFIERTVGGLIKDHLYKEVDMAWAEMITCLASLKASSKRCWQPLTDFHHASSSDLSLIRGVIIFFFFEPAMMMDA